MALKTIVKVGNISNLSDARYCAGMGVNYLGFQAVEGHNYIPPNQFQEFRGWFTGPEIIAEVYGIKSQEELASVVESYAPNLLELSLNELKSNIKPAQKFVLKVSYADFTNHQEMINQFNDKILFLDITDDPSKKDIETIAQSYQVLVSVKDVNDLQEKLSWPIAGISLQGTQEERPGLKNYDSIADILEALETDD